MGGNKTLVFGIALVALGLLGLAAMFVLGSSGLLVDDSAFTSAGQRIYYTGADANGQAIPRTIGGDSRGFGMMGGIACVDCHGEDGIGGVIGTMMFGTVDVPDIRYSVLTASHAMHGETGPGWSDHDIARAIREGYEPDGERLSAPMPRWDMTDAEVDALIDYLKELDAR